MNNKKMDFQYIQKHKNKLVYDWQQNIRHYCHKLQDKDLHISDLYKLNSLNIHCLWYILVYNWVANQ